MHRCSVCTSTGCIELRRGTSAAMQSHARWRRGMRALAVQVLAAVSNIAGAQWQIPGLACVSIQMAMSAPRKQSADMALASYHEVLDCLPCVSGAAQGSGAALPHGAQAALCLEPAQRPVADVLAGGGSYAVIYGTACLDRTGRLVLHLTSSSVLLKVASDSCSSTPAMQTAPHGAPAVRQVGCAAGAVEQQQLAQTESHGAHQRAADSAEPAHDGSSEGGGLLAGCVTHVHTADLQGALCCTLQLQAGPEDDVGVCMTWPRGGATFVSSLRVGHTVALTGVAQAARSGTAVQKVQFEWRAGDVAVCPRGARLEGAAYAPHTCAPAVQGGNCSTAVNLSACPGFLGSEFLVAAAPLAQLAGGALWLCVCSAVRGDLKACELCMHCISAQAYMWQTLDCARLMQVARANVASYV